MGEGVYIPANFSPSHYSWQQQFIFFKNCTISSLTAKWGGLSVIMSPCQGKIGTNRSKRKWYSTVLKQLIERKQSLDQNRVCNHIPLQSFGILSIHSPPGKSEYWPHDVSRPLNLLGLLLSFHHERKKICNFLCLFYFRFFFLREKIGAFEVGLNDPCGSHSTWDILWFDDLFSASPPFS